MRLQNCTRCFFFFLNCCPFVQTQQLSVAMAHIAKWVTIRGEVCQELSVNVFQALLGAVNGALAFSLKFIQWLGEKNTRCSVVPLSEFPTVLMEHAFMSFTPIGSCTQLYCLITAFLITLVRSVYIFCLGPGLWFIYLFIFQFSI